MIPDGRFKRDWALNADVLRSVLLNFILPL
jgi:hypothetical protein